MRELDHPNIVQQYEVFDVEEYVGLVLEYLDRKNLSKVIDKSPMGWRKAVRIIADVLEVLSYLHSKRVVHRDIKPANIVFMTKKSSDGIHDPVEVLKIVDFGLWANFDDHSKTSLLKDKSGTVGYLAPEIISSKSDSGVFYDDRVDVFSAGIVFYEM